MFRGYRDRIRAEAMEVEKRLMEQQEEFSKLDETKQNMVSEETPLDDHVSPGLSHAVRLSNVSNNMGWQRLDLNNNRVNQFSS